MRMHPHRFLPCWKIFEKRLAPFMNLSTRSGLKTFLAGAALAALLLLPASSVWAKPSYWVYAYTNNHNDTNGHPMALSTDIPWNNITHLVDAFAIPTSGGGVNLATGLYGSQAVSVAHANGTRAILSVGGEGQGSYFASNVSTYQSTFISNIVKAVTQTGSAQGGYDGVDIDWEFPSSTDKPNFMSFMANLYVAIKALPVSPVDGQSRTLTFFVSPGYYVCGVDWANINKYCDAAVISGYAFFIDGYNGPLRDPSTGNYSDCGGVSTGPDINGVFTKLTAKGFPATQFVLGCPFFGLYNGGSEVGIEKLLKSGIAGAYQTAQAEQIYTYNGYSTTANTAQSFCDKINWALSKGMKGSACGRSRRRRRLRTSPWSLFGT